MDIKREIDVPLKETVAYDADGEKEQASFIKLVAPTSKNLSQCARIKQTFLRAARDISSSGKESEDKDDDGSEPTGEDIVQMVYMSGVDITPMLLEFQEMLKSVGTLDGEVKLTKPLIESISIPDMEKLMGEYIANFILPSTSEKTKGK